MKTFDNVAKLKLATLTAGQFVETGGYYTKGGGGAAKYLIVAPQAADGYGDHVLANGNVSVLQVDGKAVTPEVFGATGDGNTDDTPPIQALLSSGISAELVFTKGKTYIANDLTAVSTVHISGYGALIKRADSQLNSVYVLSLEGGGSTLKGLNIDGNATNNIGHTNRGEGLRLVGDTIRIYDCDSSNTPVGGTKVGNCFYVSGDNCVLQDTTSSNGGYAACRVEGDNCKIVRPDYLNFQEKGIVFSGASKDQFTISDVVRLETNSTDASGQAPILVDPGSNKADQLGRFYGCNLVARISGGISGSNVCKVVNTKHVIIDGFDFTQTTSNFSGIRFQEYVEYVTLSNGRTDGEINLDSFDYKKVTIDNVSVGREDKLVSFPTPIQGVYAKEGVIIKNLSVYGASSGLIRVENWVGQTDTDGAPLTEPYININGITNDSVDVTVPVFFMAVPAANITPGKIVVTGLQVITGRDTYTQMMAGSSSYDALIQRNQSASSWNREFLAGAIPTSGTWKQNDKVYHANPSGSGNIGWVCLSGGSPGNWKAFGTISA